MRSTYPLVLALLLTASACPNRERETTTLPDPADKARADDIARLTIPAIAATGAALSRLGERTDAGDIVSAWARAHYLIDLFDDARFRRDDASLAVLAATMGAKAERGSEATSAALSFLNAELNRVLRINRLHELALAARALIEFDMRPPGARGQAFQRIGEIKAVVRLVDLRSNARLRLYGYCRNALGDATRAPWSLRMRVLAHCLYPLFDSDPTPYFADTPEQRPPPPRSEHILARLAELLAEVATPAGRLGLATTHLRAELEAFVAENRTRLPAPPAPADIGVPIVAHATPYDWTPLLRLGAGDNLAPTAKHIEELARPVQGDGRGAIALALASQAPLSALAHAVEVAAGAGAVRLELLVGIDQKLAVPPGDYWSGRIDGDHVTRLAVIPVMLAAAIPLPEVLANLNPHVSHWNPARAALGLHLVITSNQWRLLAANGTLALIRTDAVSADPREQLRAELARVRAAFPGERGLVLVPQPEVSYGAVLAAATTVATDASGHALLPMLAFAATAPQPRGKTLARRIDRRWQANVKISPDDLMGRSPVVLSCYQDLLEKQPQLAATLRLELSDGAVTVVSGPRNPALRSCAIAGMESAMVDRKVTSAVLTMSPK